MSTTVPPSPPPKPVKKVRASKLNEHLRLFAAAFDRLSTVVAGGAVLAPFFQRQTWDAETLAFWALAALTLHGAGHFMIYLLREET